MGTLLGGGGSRGAAAPNGIWNENAASGQRVGLDSARAAYKNAEDSQQGLRDAENFGADAAYRGYGQIQDYNDYVRGQRDQYGLLQQRAVSDATDFNDADFRERYAQRAGEQVASSMRMGDENLQRAAAARGIRANSGAYLSALNDNQIMGAMGQANAQNMAREAARLEGLRLNDRAAGMTAQGASTFGQLGMQGAGMGINAGAAPLNIRSTGLAARNQGFMQAGQMGTNVSQAATGQYNAQANFNTKDAQLRESSADPMGAMLGNATGMLGSMGAGKMVGQVAGSYFGGPIGGMIGKSIGGAVDDYAKNSSKGGGSGGGDTWGWKGGSGSTGSTGGYAGDYTADGYSDYGDISSYGDYGGYTDLGTSASDYYNGADAITSYW